MASYHFHTKTKSRSTGGSAVASASYRSAEVLVDERNGVIHDYTRKERVLHSEIMLPEFAPEWASNRQTLWNEVERAEKRKDAQLFREFELGLPSELSRDQQVALVREFCKKLTSEGIACDFSIHDENRRGNKNTHAHVMSTLRPLGENGFGAKRRDWENWNAILKNFRSEWSAMQNRALAQHGHSARVDHRTLKAQGIDRLPQIHVGPRQHTKRVARNNAVLAFNKAFEQAKDEYSKISSFCIDQNSQRQSEALTKAARDFEEIQKQEEARQKRIEQIDMRAATMSEYNYVQARKREDIARINDELTRLNQELTPQGNFLVRFLKTPNLQALKRKDQLEDVLQRSNEWDVEYAKEYKWMRSEAEDLGLVEPPKPAFRFDPKTDPDLKPKPRKSFREEMYEEIAARKAARGESNETPTPGHKRGRSR